MCGEEVKAIAQKCRFCGYPFVNRADPGPSSPLRPGTVLKIVGAVLAVVLVAQCVSSFSGPAETEAPPVSTLSDEAVKQCRDLIALAERNGIIKARPSPNRINVEDTAWAMLDAETKDRTMQAVSCDLWQSAMPPEWEHVVAYGHRSGKRIQMLTSVGMSRE